MKRQINFDIEAIGVFRKAKPEDIEMVIEIDKIL